MHYAIERQNQHLALEEKNLSLQLLARQLAAAQQKVEQLSTIDKLTQVHTRRHFDELFLEEWHRLTREQTPLSLIICDIEGLNAYNANFGQVAGNQCLQQMAKVLLRVVKRPADRVARFSGQQFIVLMPNTDLAGATHVADLIQAEMSTLDVYRDQDGLALNMGLASRIPCEDIAPSLLLEEVQSNPSPTQSQGRDSVPTQRATTVNPTVMVP